MRISDWSSDVCSSDRPARQYGGETETAERHQPPVAGLDAGRADPLVPELPGALKRRFGLGGSSITLDGTPEDQDRKSVAEGMSVSVRVDFCGRRIYKKTKEAQSKNIKTHYYKE